MDAAGITGRVSFSLPPRGSEVAFATFVRVAPLVRQHGVFDGTHTRTAITTGTASHTPDHRPLLVPSPAGGPGRVMDVGLIPPPAVGVEGVDDFVRRPG